LKTQLTETLVRRLDVPGPRYTSYPTVPEWSMDVDSTRYEAHLVAAGRNADLPLSLYFHLPFCQERCTFCGCNVVVTKDKRRADEYIERLAIEMEMAAERLGLRRSVSQIHWGGGTPTFLDEAQIERLWRKITAYFSPLPDAEIAIEIDPAVTSMRQVRLLRSLGFNRLSMGVQDFDPDVQRAINRIQTIEETRALVDEARGLGFRGINFDLIYGLPLQTAATWSKTLETVISMKPDRTAIYSFAFVPDARPHQKRLKVYGRAEGQEKLALFIDAYDAFTKTGYLPIGMDHFAREEDELARASVRRTLARNFQGYTVRAAQDVVAFGVTAIGDVGGAYFQNVAPIPKYYAAMASRRFATEKGIVLSADDHARRAIISALMCNFYVDLGSEAPAYGRELEALKSFEADGLVSIRGSTIEVSALGRMFVRNIAMVFDAYLTQNRAQRTFSRAV
jgi:oxygen-independent coproporphyrinogen III oxidase